LSTENFKAAQVMNLGRLLTHTAQLYPEHTALIQGDQTWTWSEINARVNAMANALRKLGIRKGDRILLQSRNNIQTFESGWVAFKLGCVWVPTNFRLTPPEVAYLGASSGAVAMVVEDLFQGHTDAVQAESSTLKHVITIGEPRSGELSYESLIAQHLGEDFSEETVAYDDPLWFFYTSGTTGKPKAGILTHGQMAFVVTNHLADLIPGTTEKDCSIAVAPLSHGAGIHALLNVARGAATILLPSEKFDPAVFGKWCSVIVSPIYLPSQLLSKCWWSTLLWTNTITARCAMSFMRVPPCTGQIRNVPCKSSAKFWSSILVSVRSRATLPSCPRYALGR